VALLSVLDATWWYHPGMATHQKALAAPVVEVSGEVIETPGVRFEHSVKPAKIGRPTTYDPSYPERLREWFRTFDEDEVNRIVKGESSSAQGESATYHIHAGKMPTIERWCFSMGISPFIITDWSKKNPEFCQAVIDCKGLTKQWLVNQGTRGLISPAMLSIIGANYTDLRQPTQTTVQVDATTEAITGGDLAKAEALRKLVEYARDAGMSFELAE
jgi:hypothetical protein